MDTKTGKIGVTTDNIFPVIKKFLYSDHEIFLREIVSNAIDATQKLRTLAAFGDFKGATDGLNVTVSVDPEAKTLTVSDHGIGMTADDIDKYINQIAFSGAEEFLAKYKDRAENIIGHFGLGFYSAFMVASKVEILTLSYQEGAQAVRWTCDGSPAFTMEPIEKAERGTDIVLHIDQDDDKEFLDPARIEALLKKYCRFLPVPVVFGKQKEWKDGKQVDTDRDNVINDTAPAWTRKPADLTDADYLTFYHELYPGQDDPMFWIHLNVDYPFTLTGILFFPKIKSNIELNRQGRIQLYCNQVYVTDSVEGVVPDFMMLMQGVIDSPDIPLNVSRSYLQSDSAVKKISGYITRKVADRLDEIFAQNRADFEAKWDDIKIFIEYGMLTDEKFADRAKKFLLLKDTEGKAYTLDEYKALVEPAQVDKSGTTVYLYATDPTAQYSYVSAATARGYDVLVMNGQLDSHFVGLLEQKIEKSRFVRVDADVIDNLIAKEERRSAELSPLQRTELTTIFRSQLPKVEKADFIVSFEALDPTAAPVTITQSEYMRRMKEMAALQPGMAFYADLPDNYNMVVNTEHRLIGELRDAAATALDATLQPIAADIDAANAELKALRDAQANKADKPSPSDQSDQSDQSDPSDKSDPSDPSDPSDSSDSSDSSDPAEKIAALEKKLADLRDAQDKLIADYAATQPRVKQLIDLALLGNGLLRGADLSSFINRSVDLL